MIDAENRTVGRQFQQLCVLISENGHHQRLPRFSQDDLIFFKIMIQGLYRKIDLFHIGDQGKGEVGVVNNDGVAVSNPDSCQMIQRGSHGQLKAAGKLVVGRNLLGNEHLAGVNHTLRFQLSAETADAGKA